MPCDQKQNKTKTIKQKQYCNEFNKTFKKVHFFSNVKKKSNGNNFLKSEGGPHSSDAGRERL